MAGPRQHGGPAAHRGGGEQVRHGGPARGAHRGGGEPRPDHGRVRGLPRVLRQGQHQH